MARPSKRLPTKRLSKQLPRTIRELVEAGGPETLARNAAVTAAANATRQQREFWLGVLEGINQDDLDAWDEMFCIQYIRDLRRKLGIRQPKELIREQTRLRVRRFRERRVEP